MNKIWKSVWWSYEILSDIPKCIFLFDDHAMIQSFEKLQGCNTLEDYADALVASVFKHFGHPTTQVMSH